MHRAIYGCRWASSLLRGVVNGAGSGKGGGNKAVHTTAVLERKKSYYDVLGVGKGASHKQIKQAYYFLAKKYHPDSTGGKDVDSRKLFLDVSEAYEVLSDESKRNEYDQWGNTWDDVRRPESYPGSHEGPEEDPIKAQTYARRVWNFESNVEPEELFRRIFGSAYDGGGRIDPFEEQYKYAKSLDGYGAAEEIVLGLTFEEAAIGGSKEVTINVVDRCLICAGTRCMLGTKPVTCETCDGAGMEMFTKGSFIMRSTCSECNGEKVRIFHPCTECQGEGKMVLRKKVPIPIPPGVRDGQTNRVDVGLSEITVTYFVEKSNYFRKDNFDIHTVADISISQAFLGGETTIQGLYESIIIEITPGTSSHEILQLKGRGIKLPDGKGYGDHYIQFRVHIPSNLSIPEKEFLTAFATLDDSASGTVNGVVKPPKSPSSSDPPVSPWPPNNRKS